MTDEMKDIISSDEQDNGNVDENELSLIYQDYFVFAFVFFKKKNSPYFNKYYLGYNVGVGSIGQHMIGKKKKQMILYYNKIFYEKKLYIYIK